MPIARFRSSIGKSRPGRRWSSFPLPRAAPELEKVLIFTSDDWPQVGEDIEGMALADRRTLLIVSDNDFGARKSKPVFTTCVRRGSDARLTGAGGGHSARLPDSAIAIDLKLNGYKSPLTSRGGAGRGAQMDSDQAYFTRRASEERTAALQARNRAARRSHTQMAERYEELVRALVAEQRRLGLRPVAVPQPSATSEDQSVQFA